MRWTARSLLFTLLVTACGLAWAAEAPARTWAFSGSVLGYLVPHDRDFAMPTVMADRDAFHLEARYNYESLDTASLWAGYNFKAGEEVTLNFTMMGAGVFGDIHGMAPGYRAVLGWKKLELSSESEYFLDTDGHSGDFFYTWSELSVRPWERLRLGGVVQKTRAYETERDIQRGFLVGVPFKQMAFTTYILNPDQEPTIVLALSADF